MLTKTEPCASFFNFFAPPAEPDEDAGIDEDELEELRAALEDDFELGCAAPIPLFRHTLPALAGCDEQEKLRAALGGDFELGFMRTRPNLAHPGHRGCCSRDSCAAVEAGFEHGCGCACFPASALHVGRGTAGNVLSFACGPRMWHPAADLSPAVFDAV